ncbi:MAG: radical SAM protein [bacterium]
MRVEYREEPCKIALSPVKGMHFEWSLNPYMGCVHRCTFCYVRAFEKRADRPSDDRYGTSIRVKPNIVEVLRRELQLRSRRRAHVAIGSATDPYQPAEGRYKLTRGCIQALGEAKTRFSIITRGPMAVRDIDVMVEASKRTLMSVSFSVPTLDDGVWRKTEPGTAPPRQRLKVLRELADAGLNAGVSMAPILPGLSDGREQMENVIKAARDSGAQFIWCGTLRLSPGTREHFMECLARDWPELLPRYEGMYSRVGAPRWVTEPIEAMANALKQRYEVTGESLRSMAWEQEGEQLALFNVQPTASQR